MGRAKYIGSVGALAVAMGVAVLAVVMPAPASTVPPTVRLAADSTALLLCGIACPTWNDAHIEDIKNKFLAPTHPGQDIDYVAVTTPSEVWPLTGIFRAMGLLGLGEPGCARPGGDCWPDYPLWKLSGLLDLTYDQSVQKGVAELEAAMAAAGNDHLVIFGDDQGANVATVMKHKLAEQYPRGTVAPDIDFVLTGDSNVPNGGLHARFPGVYVPIGWTFDGPEPTNTQFHTDVVIRQYDGIADFPLYPLNPVATLNAVLGVIYVHPFFSDVSLSPDPTAVPATVSQRGDTTYYVFATKDLPLFGPLRTLGVPEPLIDVVEPFFQVLVELGYDRTIPSAEPTPARLIPPLEPAKVATDLVNAIREGATNAAALFGAPAPSSAASLNKAANTEPAAADGVPAVRVPSASVASIRERVKPAVRPAISRPPVRNSLDATKGPRGLRHPTNGTGTSAKPAARATTEGSSPAS